MSGNNSVSLCACLSSTHIFDVSLCLALPTKQLDQTQSFFNTLELSGSETAANKIRLSEVATVRDKWSENPDRSYYNGKLSVRIQVNTTNSEDLITVAESTRNYIEEFNLTHDGVKLNITQDSSVRVKQRTLLLMKNAGQGMALVLLFLALFLKPRLAFWVAFGLPISFLGMFIFADQFGVTINILSLFGMIIVIGIFRLEYLQHQLTEFIILMRCLVLRVTHGRRGNLCFLLFI